MTGPDQDKINLDGLSVDDLLEYCKANDIDTSMKIEISDHEGNNIKPAQAVGAYLNGQQETVLWLRG